MIKKHLITIILVTLFVKIVYFLFAEIVSINNPFPNIDDYIFMDHKDKHGLINIIALNDGQWYKGIAEKGQIHIKPEDLLPNKNNNYSRSSYGFFPLYPYIIRLLMKITGLGFVNSGFILSLVFTLTLFVFFYKFSIIALEDEAQAYWATLLLIVFPYHFYYSMLYTESLYLILLLLSFYSIEKENWFVFILSSSLLVLARASGIIMGLPLFIYLIERTKNNDILSRQTIIKLSLFLFMLIIYILYGIYLKYMTGEYFAFIIAEKGWNRSLTFNPIAGLFIENFWRAYVLSAYAIVFIIIGLLSYKIIRISFLLVIFLGIALPLAAGSSIAIPRYISVLFPFMYIFSNKLIKTNYKLLTVTILFCIQILSFYFFLTEDYLGY